MIDLSGGNLPHPPPPPSLKHNLVPILCTCVSFFALIDNLKSSISRPLREVLHNLNKLTELSQYLNS